MKNITLFNNLFLKNVGLFIGTTFLFLSFLDTASANSDLGEQELKKLAAASLQVGHFVEAANYWQDLRQRYSQQKRIVETVDALTSLAEIYQRLGHNRQALRHITEAKAINDELDTPVQQAAIAINMAKLHYLTGEREEAEHYFESALTNIDREKKTNEAASLLNNYANLQTANRNYDKAIALYKESQALAKKSSNLDLEINATMNLAKAFLELDRVDEVWSALQWSSKQITRLVDSHHKAFTLVTIGRLSDILSQRQVLPVGINKNTMRLFSHEALNNALQIAEKIDDKVAKSYALGYLGSMYETDRRYDESLYLSQKALFTAQELNAPEIYYRWQWQIGRILKRSKDFNGAIVSYKRTLNTIQQIREDLAIDCKRGARLSFRETVGPVYFELAEILLIRSDKQIDLQKKEQDLLAARDTIEQLKTVELQDYFQDDCVVALQARKSNLDAIISDTAIIYPVLLQDHLELIVSFTGSIKQYRVNVTKEALTEETSRFRHKLQNPTSRYLRHAKKLYTWLIAPIVNDLTAEKVTTLIFVPDGPLRTIPLSALHDGNQFLINKYAIATTPGLTLTDPVPISRKESKLLLNGLTKSVQGFPALPYVAAELNKVKEGFDVTMLEDESFVVQAVKSSLERTPYTIVHIASHGQFDSDPQKTFLLTHDGKLTMDNLESLMGLSKFRENPVELLTLSACQTAVGDERAALGLAGVAIKSGARSALASLWFINDKATGDLVGEFYQQLRNFKISKARALQLAQTNILKKSEYQHPAYWAPFLLIGNWL